MTPSKAALAAWDALSVDAQANILCANYDDVAAHWQLAFDAGRKSLRDEAGEPKAWLCPELNKALSAYQKAVLDGHADHYTKPLFTLPEEK